MKKSATRPNAEEFKREISCRWDVLCHVSPEHTKDKVPPCPAQWPLKKVLKWLEEHPNEDEHNRKYLFKVIDH